MSLVGTRPESIAEFLWWYNTRMKWSKRDFYGELETVSYGTADIYFAASSLWILQYMNVPLTHVRYKEKISPYTGTYKWVPYEKEFAFNIK